MDETKKKIRPIYSELRGYSSVTLKDETIFDDLAEKLASQLNNTIDELNIASKQNYEKFKIQVTSIEWNRSYRRIIRSIDYQTKLSGLISKLQGEFFSEEQLLSSGPSTIINTHQSQTQYQQQSIAVDIAMIVAEKRADYLPGTPERTFLDKLGEALKTAKGVQDIIQNIISIATSTGVGLEFLKKIFSI